MIRKGENIMSTTLLSFVTVYKNKKTQEEKEQIIKEHILDVYIPYEQKAEVANAIVKGSFYQNTDDGKQVFHIDSIAKYMLSCIAIFDLYTDIERSKTKGKMLDDFNTLNRYGIFDYLIQNINQRELKEFNMVLQMASEDIISNEYEPHAFIRNQVERFGNMIGGVLEPLIATLDIDKIKEIVSDFQRNN